MNTYSSENVNKAQSSCKETGGQSSNNSDPKKDLRRSGQNLHSKIYMMVKEKGQKKIRKSSPSPKSDAHSEIAKERQYTSGYESARVTKTQKAPICHSKASLRKKTSVGREKRLKSRLEGERRDQARQFVGTKRRKENYLNYSKNNLNSGILKSFLGGTATDTKLKTYKELQTFNTFDNTNHSQPTELPIIK